MVHARLQRVLTIAGFCCACGSSSSQPPDARLPDASPPDAPDYDDPAQIQSRLERSLEDLASFGNKRAGTAAGFAAGDYLADAFRAAGLEDVRFEEFTFPAFELEGSSLAFTVDGAPLTVGHDVLAYSGAGTVSGVVVHVGVGKENDYAGVDATGKIVMVDRDPVFHRQAQYALVIAHGGTAMLFASAAPDNQPQIGTVTDPEDGLGPIPALTIGRDDGVTLATAIAAGQAVQATLSVDASIAPASGRNVVGSLPGTDPGGAYFLVGAHYDTWFEGAVDNASGVAAIREIAAAAAAGAPRRFGLVFVGFDAEELGLFGGYDYLRRHVVVGGEPALGFLNFEMPASRPGPGIKAIAYTATSALIDPLRAAGLDAHYPYFVPMAFVPEYFGGLIPTDIQGMYWYGMHGTTTFCETPYYHTPGDTHDRVDTGYLADSVLRFEQVLDSLDAVDPTLLGVRDPSLWTAEVTTDSSSGPLDVTVAVRTAEGTPAVGAQVTVWLDVDDFTRAFRAELITDDTGTAQVAVPETALTAGSGGRWLHVTAGQTYPLAEAIVPLP